MNYTEQLNKFLSLIVEQQASDLHIAAGHPPTLRIAGKLVPLVRQRTLSIEDAKNIVKELLTEDQLQKFLQEKELDFSYTFGKAGRFRCNAFMQRGEFACSLRLIPNKIKTLKELKLPPVLHAFTKATQGFVLITGPTSHGKSTTLAAMIDEINYTRPEHIITIEDPIEYIFEDDRAIIDQREVGRDTLSFSNALRASFRQDPDIIMVGEMRDAETMSIAITAAETGHLVFATLHTNSAAQTIHRIVDTFPPSQQSQIRSQLSGSLLGIVSQRLIPSIQGGRVPSCEVLINNSAIANLIRENKIYEIPTIMETSARQGMISLNRSLSGLVRTGKISLEDAVKFSLNPKEIKNLSEKI